MDSNIKASFIPDKMPSQSSRGGQQNSPEGGSAADILILVAIVALAASLALAAGVFLYDRFLESNVQKKGVQLERARQAFEPALINELLRLDTRLQAADEVLTRHLAPSELFNLIEELTLKSVAYEALDYTVGEGDSIRLKLRGKARSVNGVALQASVFGQHNAITNPIFSDLDLVSDGVRFEVSAAVNPSAIQYTTVFSQYSSGVQEETTVPEGSLFPEGDNVEASTEGEAFGDFGGGGVTQ